MARERPNGASSDSKALPPVFGRVERRLYSPYNQAMIKIKSFMIVIAAILSIEPLFAETPPTNFMESEAWQLAMSRYIGFLKVNGSKEVDLLVPLKTQINKADSAFISRAFTSKEKIKYTIYTEGIEFSDDKNRVLIHPVNFAKGEYLINGKKFVYDPKQTIEAQFRKTFPEAFKTTDAKAWFHGLILPDAVAADMDDHGMAAAVAVGVESGAIMTTGLGLGLAAVGGTATAPVWALAAGLIVGGGAAGGIIYCAWDIHLNRSSGPDFVNCMGRPLKWIGVGNPRDRLYSAKVVCEKTAATLTAAVRLKSSTGREQYRRFTFDEDGNIQSVDFSERGKNGVAEFKNQKVIKVKFNSATVTNDKDLRDYNGLTGDGSYYRNLCKDQSRITKFNQTAWDEGAHRDTEIPMESKTTH
jgi:hypothetical protein